MTLQIIPRAAGTPQTSLEIGSEIGVILPSFKQQQKRYLYHASHLDSLRNQQGETILDRMN